MTPTTKPTATTYATHTPLTSDEVKRMLRDAAFVLQMTRCVKAEILADRPESAKPALRKASELPACLGV